MITDHLVERKKSLRITDNPPPLHKHFKLKPTVIKGVKQKDQSLINLIHKTPSITVESPHSNNKRSQHISDIQYNSGHSFFSKEVQKERLSTLNSRQEDESKSSANFKSLTPLFQNSSSNQTPLILSPKDNKAK